MVNSEGVYLRIYYSLSIEGMICLFSGIKAIVKKIIFPQGPGCPLCGRKGSPRHLCELCLEMWAELARDLIPCEKCGRFHPVQVKDRLCPDCKESEPLYSLARGVAPYEGQVRDAIHQFKFSGKRGLAYPLGELMAAMAQTLFPMDAIEVLIPVPLHEKRLRERGFNQAGELAQVMGGLLKKPVVTDLLVRYRETPSQTSLNREERQLNLQHAFRSEKDDIPCACESKGVLLVDDVYTTGATVRECSRVLIDSGVKKVYVVTLASGILLKPSSSK